VIVYLWAAVTTETVISRGSLGISDDAGHARDAAGQCLRDGHAALAVVEAAQIGMHPQSFIRRYERTGTGWWGTPGQSGQVRWTPFTSPDAAARLPALAAREADRDA
jgi:hypothetical protein